MINLELTDYSKNVILFTIGYAFFIFILFFLLLLFKKNKNKIEFVDFLVILIIVILSGIRYKVGVDYESYLNYYNRIINFYPSFSLGITTSSNPLWYVLCYWVKTIWGHQYGIFWVSSIFIYTITLFTIIKRSDKPIYSFLLFGMMGFLGNSTNILKQWMAMTLLFYSLKYVQKDKYFRFILLGIIALGFHPISILFVALLIIAKKFIKPNKNHYRLMIIIGIIALILFLLIPRVLKYIPYINSEQFLNYFSGDISGYSATMYGKLSTISYLICYLPLIYIVVHYSNDLIKNNSDNRLYINMLLLSMPFIILILRQRYIFRVAIFLNLPIVYLLPMIPNCVKSSENKKYMIILLSSIVLIFFICYTIFNRDIYFSYNTYLNL